MGNLADQSGHAEIAKAPVIPLGHYSAQATFPWNFAAWNPNRTLCIASPSMVMLLAPISVVMGRDNVEWGRHRNIDGIPGLMVEGEYEWWEARVNPALALRMMYPESCISFLCDTGRGHFDCGDRTALYLAKFIQKALEHVSVAVFDSLNRVLSLNALAQRDRVIAQLNALPNVVAVHAEITALNGGDLPNADFFQLFSKLAHIGYFLHRTKKKF